MNIVVCVKQIPDTAAERTLEPVGLEYTNSARRSSGDLILVREAAEDLLSAVWVPIIHPCWSGSMPVLVEGAAEPVPSADIQLRDPLRIGNRFG